MKYTLLLFLTVLLLVNKTHAQSSTWNKNDRDNIYNDCLSYISSNYGFLTNDQKETMSLCFLEQITNKYSKESYQAKIEVELKRLKSSVTGECAKTLGMELKKTEVKAEDTIKAPTAWNKSEKDDIYKKCLSSIWSSKNYTADQKETICICTSNQITTKYSKDTWRSFLDVEANKIQYKIAVECISSNGFEIKQQVKNDKPTKENLIGHWKDKHENSEFWLYDGGNFSMTTGGRRSNGSWKIQGDNLSLTFDKLFGTKQKDYEILMFNENKFVYQSLKNGTTYTVDKIK